GRTELGLVWVRRVSTSQSIVFEPFGFDLTGVAGVSQPLTLTTPAMDGEGSSLVYDKKNDRYVAAFFDASPSKRVVYGTVIGKDAKIVVPPTDVGKSPAQTRDVAVVALGDRNLFV